MPQTHTHARTDTHRSDRLTFCQHTSVVYFLLHAPRDSNPTHLLFAQMSAFIRVSAPPAFMTLLHFRTSEIVTIPHKELQLTSAWLSHYPRTSQCFTEPPFRSLVSILLPTAHFFQFAAISVTASQRSALTAGVTSGIRGSCSCFPICLTVQCAPRLPL